MTASDATATIKKGAPEPGFDKTAQRILNLFFVLNSSPEPLTTEQIVLDSDLGYGSGNIDSDKRKFRRDRDKLLERGIVIREVRAAGAQETEESAWTIDREHTFAAGGLITADDADILLNAIDQTLAAGSSAFAAPLADIRSKIAYLTGMSTTGEAPIRRSPAVDAVWSAFAERCALRFLYQNGRGEQRERTVCVYGMFEREGTAYFCGLDNATDNIRTFRCDRIIRAWRPSKAYTILRISTSTITYSLSSILPTVHPLRLRSRSRVRRRPIWSAVSHADEANSRAPKQSGPGPLTCATLKPQPHFAWPMPWMA